LEGCGVDCGQVCALNFEAGGGLLHLLHVFESDGEGELRLLSKGDADGSVIALHLLELALQGAEEVGEGHGAEPLFEVGDGVGAKLLALDVAEEADVVAAGLFSLEGDLAAELAGGEIVLAEAGVGHGTGRRGSGFAWPLPLVAGTAMARLLPERTLLS
jgi:hypothetical protein